MKENYMEFSNIMDLNLSLDSKIILLWQKKGWGLYPSSKNIKSLKQLVKKGRAKNFLKIECPHVILPLVKNDKNYDEIINASMSMGNLPCYTEFYYKNNDFIYLDSEKMHPLESILFDGNMTLVLDKRVYGGRILEKANPTIKFPYINIDFKLVTTVSIYCINNYKKIAQMV